MLVHFSWIWSCITNTYQQILHQIVFCMHKLDDYFFFSTCFLQTKFWHYCHIFFHDCFCISEAFFDDDLISIAMAGLWCNDILRSSGYDHYMVDPLHPTDYGQWTPNECMNQRNLKFWVDVADKICFGRTYKFGIFPHRASVVRGITHHLWNSTTELTLCNRADFTLFGQKWSAEKYLRDHFLPWKSAIEPLFSLSPAAAILF